MNNFYFFVVVVGEAGLAGDEVVAAGDAGLVVPV